MTGSVIGEPTEQFVTDQVKIRQETYGKGYINSRRTPEDIQFMNNRNAWIKMASSVLVNDPDRLPEKSYPSKDFEGSGLAQKAVLFNGLSSFENSTLKQRFGANVGPQHTPPKNTNYNNSAYGLGGNDFGILPMPGISSVSVDSKNRGSIKTATVQITAYNRYQFDLIETLYCRLGFSMIIEWGWDKYIDNKGVYKIVGSTVVENEFFTTSNQDTIIRSLLETAEDNDGNTGGLFGKVVNFNWKYDADGSYKITVKITGLGDVIESMKINQSPSKELKNSLGDLTHDRFEFLENAKSSIHTNRTITKLGTVLYKFLNKQSIWTQTSDANYFNLYLELKKSSYSSFLGNNGAYGIKIQYNYFIRFGELLNIISQNITPDVNNTSKFVEFDSDEDAVICSIQPNLISFDPAVCMIKLEHGKNLNQNDISGIDVPDYTANMKSFSFVDGSNTGAQGPNYQWDISISGPGVNQIRSVPSISQFASNSYESSPGIFTPLLQNEKFIAQTKITGAGTVINNGDMLYGKIYNIYLNYDMIFTTLSKNVDKKGNLTFFKFLQSMCDNINSAFANVVDIEPIIKDDKVITFMDAKPVAGLKDKLNSFNNNVPTSTAKFEVVGFNSGENPTQGTFLKNISFNTKFSPKLASQLSIGATAAGVALGQDATGLSKWNKGLVDRYQETITDPNAVANTGGNTVNNVNSTPPPQSGAGNPGYGGSNSVLIQAIGQTLTLAPDTFPKDVNLGIPMTKEIVPDGNGGYKAVAGVTDIIVKISKDGEILSSNFGNGLVFVDPNDSTNNVNSSIGGRIPITQDLMVATAPAAALRDVVDLGTGIGQSVNEREATNIIQGDATNSIRTSFINFSINKNTFSTLQPTSRNWAKKGIGGIKQIEHAQNQIVKVLMEGYGLNPTYLTIDNPATQRSNNKSQTRATYKYNPPANATGTAAGLLTAQTRALAGINYSAYLAQMFGGAPNVTSQQAANLNIVAPSSVSKKDSEYTFRPNVDSYAKSGKSSYKVYLDEANKIAMANSTTGKINASNQMGLLPIEFDMEMDGIAGFRIYNKIGINQRFLPRNYAESLEFLIKGVSHKIDGSGWTTNLQTLSTSNLNARPVSLNSSPPRSRRTTTIPANVTAMISTTPTPSPTAYQGDPRLQPIKDMIALHESRNRYDISNQGSRGNYNLTKATIPDNTIVVGKTIEELLNQRSTTFSQCSIPICTFAMGRYQIIPNTLKSLLRSTSGLSTTNLFSPANQEKLCDTLLFNSRPNIGKYIDGSVSGTQQDLSKAVQSLSQEWASMPATIKDKLGNTNVGNVATGTGNTGYYQGTVNRSTTSETVGDIVKALIATRRLYSTEPSFVPSYV